MRPLELTALSETHEDIIKLERMSSQRLFACLCLAYHHLSRQTATGSAEDVSLSALERVTYFALEDKSRTSSLSLRSLASTYRRFMVGRYGDMNGSFSGLTNALLCDG